MCTTFMFSNQQVKLVRPRKMKILKPLCKIVPQNDLFWRPYTVGYFLILRFHCYQGRRLY